MHIGGKNRLKKFLKFELTVFTAFISVMYRMPGAGGSSKSTNEKEEKKLARQSVWHSVYFFVGYVLLLRLGKFHPNITSLRH